MSAHCNDPRAQKLSEYVLGSFPDLFIYLPSELRNKYELSVGDSLLCSVLNFRNSAGILEQDENEHWRIEGYWNELHIPKKIAEQYQLQKGDKVEIELKGIIRQNGEYERIE